MDKRIKILLPDLEETREKRGSDGPVAATHNELYSLGNTRHLFPE